MQVIALTFIQSLSCVFIYNILYSHWSRQKYRYKVIDQYVIVSYVMLFLVVLLTSTENKSNSISAYLFLNIFLQRLNKTLQKIGAFIFRLFYTTKQANYLKMPAQKKKLNFFLSMKYFAIYISTVRSFQAFTLNPKSKILYTKLNF